MKHQIEGLEFLKDKPHAGLFFEQGLGKTLTILKHLEYLKNKGDKPFPCLIVCPLSVVSVWEREIQKFGFDFSTTKLIGTRMQRINKLLENSDIYIINYEGFRLIKQYFFEKEFSTIIFDESHRIGNRGSQQTAAAFDLAGHVKYRYILTGTPIPNSPENIWSQIHFIKPGYLNNFYSFRANHVDFIKITIRSKNGSREIQKPYRFKRLKELEEKTSRYCLRKTKAECLDLPEKIYKTIPCELSKQQSKAYYDLKYTLATQLESGQLRVVNAAPLVSKLQQICQGFVYDQNKKAHYFKDNNKLKTLKDLLIDLDSEKVIIMTHFKADMELLSHELKDVIIYDGNSEERQACVDEFQNPEGRKIFLSNIEKAKEGITLTASNHMIFYSNTYNYGSRAQVEDRNHRIGTKGNVVYYDLVCSGTIDERVVDILQNKKDTADKVLGDSLRIAEMACE